MSTFLAVLGVHRLAGDAECVSDLLPGPALLPGVGDRGRLDLLSEPVQGADRAEPHRRIAGPDPAAEITCVHLASVYIDNHQASI
jgi:hypothetical protein